MFADILRARVRVEWVGRGDRVADVRVGGYAVEVLRGKLTF